MQDFINPKSMMTPGIAGGMMMFIVNGVVFAFPELPARMLALVLSFLIGSVVFTAQNKAPSPIWAKGVYWVVNSLIIFVVGFGTAHLAADNNTQAPNKVTSSFLMQPFIASAYAEGNNTESADTKKNSSESRQTLEEQLQLERENNAALARQLEMMKANQTESAAEPASASSQLPRRKNKSQDSSFFKQW